MGNCLLRWWTGGEPKSEYFSPRIAEMMRSRSQFPSAEEHEIEHSRVHWTEERGLPDSSEDNNNDEDVNRGNLKVELENLKVGIENLKVFKELMDDPQWKHHERGDGRGNFFYICSPSLKLGRKIAEGGQAEIFEVLEEDGTASSEMLLKVFKSGSRLSDLRTQWPCGILGREVVSIVVNGLMLIDGRFAFGMNRCWGDLRKLIDLAMLQKNNQAPPFPHQWSGFILHAKDIVKSIAFHMVMLHEKGIIHQDLKAANILLHVYKESYSVLVADFECSIGVHGIGFWRAPEILLASLNGTKALFSKKANVYSYGMICFEIVTGRLPFEGELEACRASYNLVIEGQRPKLPSDLDVALKDLIQKCWNPNPNERPSFLEIYRVLVSLI